MTYEKFVGELNCKIKSDDDFYYELLVKVIKEPERYTGIFRLSNAKTKLIQNVTQSREIKFGDFMEDIVTEYIDEMGYQNLSKDIGSDEEGNALSADQVFKRGDVVYLIEQKIRDDHDSTKKRGQYQNFKKKYTLLKKQHPGCRINATMWFIDENFGERNRKYYQDEAEAETLSGLDIYILYGGTLFSNLFHREDVWEEICSHLNRNKQERRNELLVIPDFDSSPEMLAAIRRLKRENTRNYNKLISDKPKYVQLRRELFPTGQNLENI